MNVHRNFIFLGAVPIDCHKLDYCSTYNINFNKYKADGYDFIGVIPNLDYHDQSGSHWVAMFFNLKTGEAYFYDPTGHTYPKILTQVFDEFKKYCNSNGLKYNLRVNNVKHQRDGSECGVYSINFIVRLLNGETFDEILENGLTFEEINSCRLKYFRVPYSKDREIHPKCY